jgi:hypothetical protein
MGQGRWAVLREVGVLHPLWSSKVVEVTVKEMKPPAASTLRRKGEALRRRA